MAGFRTLGVPGAVTPGVHARRAQATTDRTGNPAVAATAPLGIRALQTGLPRHIRRTPPKAAPKPQPLFA